MDIPEPRMPTHKKPFTSETDLKILEIKKDKVRKLKIDPEYNNAKIRSKLIWYRPDPKYPSNDDGNNKKLSDLK